MAQVDKIPVVMVAPVLCVVAAEAGEGVVRARRRQELACSACRKGNLNTAQANVPVDIVFEYECGLEARIEEPVQAANQFSVQKKACYVKLQPIVVGGCAAGCLPAQSIVVAQPS